MAMCDPFPPDRSRGARYMQVEVTLGPLCARCTLHYVVAGRWLMPSAPLMLPLVLLAASRASARRGEYISILTNSVCVCVGVRRPCVCVRECLALPQINVAWPRQASPGLSRRGEEGLGVLHALLRASRQDGEGRHFAGRLNLSAGPAASSARPPGRVPPSGRPGPPPSCRRRRAGEASVCVSASVAA